MKYFLTEGKKKQQIYSFECFYCEYVCPTSQLDLLLDLLLGIVVISVGTSSVSLFLMCYFWFFFCFCSGRVIKVSRVYVGGGGGSYYSYCNVCFFLGFCHTRCIDTKLFLYVVPILQELPVNYSIFILL